MRRAKLTCNRKDNCPVCSRRRYVRAAKPMAYAAQYMVNPKFVTFTFRPTYIAPGTHPKQQHKMASDAFRRLRQTRWFRTIKKYVRVFEFGSKGGRIHIHMICEDPKNKIPYAKNPGSSLRMYKNRLSKDARRFYDGLKTYGMGIYDCSRARSRSKTAGYIAKYINKVDRDASLLKKLDGARLYSISTACPRPSNMKKRHCYKSTKIILSKNALGKYADVSETLLTPMFNIPSMERESTMKKDDQFQLEGAILNDNFWTLANDYRSSYIRLNAMRAAAREYDKSTPEFLSQYRPAIRDVVRRHYRPYQRIDNKIFKEIKTMYLNYVRTHAARASDLPPDDFDINLPDHVHHLISAVIDVESMLYELRTTFKCTASIGFLVARIHLITPTHKSDYVPAHIVQQ